MQPIYVSEESEVGGEIERIEIGVAVGQTLRRNSQGVEAQYLNAVGQIGLEVRDHALGVERGDKHQLSARTGEFGYGFCCMAKDGVANPTDLLDEGADNFNLVEGEDLVEGLGSTARIVDGYRSITCQGLDQCSPRSSGAWMGQRLIKGVPSADVVKGFDAQGHNGVPILKEAGRIRPILHP